MSLHLDPESCDVRVDTDGSLVVVARHGRFVVGGYSAEQHTTIDVLRRRAVEELEKSVRFAGEP